MVEGLGALGNHMEKKIDNETLFRLFYRGNQQNMVLESPNFLRELKQSLTFLRLGFRV